MRKCYYVNDSFAERRNGEVYYHLALVTEDQAGYEKGYEHRDLETLEKMAQVGNEAVQITPRDVLEIVASSMRAGPVRR